MKCKIQMHISCRLREQDQRRFLFATRCWISIHSQSVQSVCSAPEACSTSGLGQIGREHVVTLANQKAVGETEAVMLKTTKL